MVLKGFHTVVIPMWLNLLLLMAKKIAKLGYWDCGATTNWQTYIEIVDVKTGKVFNGFLGLDGKPEDLEVIWESDTKLTFTNFPIEKLLRFNQDYSSGVSVAIK